MSFFNEESVVTVLEIIYCRDGTVDYIAMISKISNHYGNHLIALMEKYSASNLQEVTQEQAKEFYITLTAGKERK